MLITLLIITNYWMKVLFTMNCKEIKIITACTDIIVDYHKSSVVKYRDCESHFPIASSNLRPLCLYSLNQILENRIFTKLLISACLTHILLMIDHDTFQNQVVFCWFEKYVYIWTTFKVFGSLIRACYTVNRTRTVLGLDITSPTFLQGAERDM